MRRREMLCALGLVLGAFFLIALTSSSAQAKIWTVDINRTAFAPPSVTIAPGDTVKWVNADTITHTTTSLTPGLWDSGNLGPGGTFEHAFAISGTFNYQCTIHLFLGTVVVSSTGASSETWGRVKQLYKERR